MAQALGTIRSDKMQQPDDDNPLLHNPFDDAVDAAHGTEAAHLRGEMAGLNPNDPNYLPKMNAYVSAHGAMEHPTSTLGKIGHTLARMGNIAGDILAPGTMSLIPGTDLYKERQSAIQNRRQQEEAKQATSQEQADTGKERADTEASLAPSEQDLRAAQTKNLEHEAQKPFAEPKADWVAGVNPTNKQPEYYDRAAKAWTGITPYEKPEADKIPPHITKMLNGKPHIMERDPNTGEYSIDRGEAPESYGQLTMPTRTTELLGPDNVMHRYQFNPETQKYDIDMGAAPTGAAAHAVFQAGRIEDVGPRLIQDINANRDVLGKLDSYYKQWLLGTPVSDPKAAQIMSELMSFAALQPALHGFRSHNAMEAFEKIIGGLAKNPDATIASIDGILKTAGSFNVGPGKPAGAGAGEKGDRFKVGDTVYQNGHAYKVTKVDANGKVLGAE